MIEIIISVLESFNGIDFISVPYMPNNNGTTENVAECSSKLRPSINSTLQTTWLKSEN